MKTRRTVENKGIELYSLELEILKLYNIESLSQKQIAFKLGMTQPSISRALKRINYKLSQVLFSDEDNVVVKNRDCDNDYLDTLKS